MGDDFPATKRSARRLLWLAMIFLSRWFFLLTWIYLYPKDPNSFNHSASWVGLGDRIGRHRASALLEGIEVVENHGLFSGHMQKNSRNKKLVQESSRYPDSSIHTWFGYSTSDIFPTLYFSSLSPNGPWAILGHLGPPCHLPRAGPTRWLHQGLIGTSHRSWWASRALGGAVVKTHAENRCLRWPWISPDLYLSVGIRMNQGCIMVFHGFTCFYGVTSLS